MGEGQVLQWGRHRGRAQGGKAHVGGIMLGIKVRSVIRR